MSLRDVRHWVWPPSVERAGSNALPGVQHQTGPLVHERAVTRVVTDSRPSAAREGREHAADLETQSRQAWKA
jgi:hypothetical protein